MSFAADTDTDSLAKPQTLMRVPMGLASPLWGLFAGAAVTGATWWWMTRWARPENLEAMFGAAAKVEAAVEPAAAVEAETLEAAVAAAAEPIVEAIAEPAIEAQAAAEPIAEAIAEMVEETAPAPVLEALVEAEPDLQPVGGEAAPISPVLEALAEEPLEAAAVLEPDPAETAPEGELVAVTKAKKKTAAPKAD